MSPEAQELAERQYAVSVPLKLYLVVRTREQRDPEGQTDAKGKEKWAQDLQHLCLPPFEQLGGPLQNCRHEHNRFAGTRTGDRGTPEQACNAP